MHNHRHVSGHIGFSPGIKLHASLSTLLDQRLRAEVKIGFKGLEDIYAGEALTCNNLTFFFWKQWQ